MKWTIFLALVLSVAMGSCARTQQGIVGTGTYQVLDLGVHPGFDTSEPSGINSLGQVSGFSIKTSDSSRRAFFYDTPHCQRIDVGAAVPQQASSDAMAINDSAMVVGSFRRADDGRLRAFSFHQGVFRDVGGGEGVEHHALAVNKSGKIVGFESVPTLPTENAVAYTNGQSVPFPIVGTAYVNRATGISDSGEVTGPLKAAGGQTLGMKYFPNLTRWYQIRPAASHPQLPDFDRVMQPRAINASGNVTGTIGSTVPHAFLSRNHFELTRDLGTLDSAHPEWFSVGYAINASAHVVGVAQTGSGITAFLHNTITMIDLNTKLSDAPGWRLIGALAINDKGLVAAQASLNNGPGRAVLLVPVSRVGPVTPLCPPTERVQFTLTPVPSSSRENDLALFVLTQLYMLSAIAHAWHPSHNLEIAPPPAFSPEVLPIVTTRSMGYVGEWKRKSNDSGAGDVMAPCGPKPRSICITAWPCNCSCVAVVVVDGIQATGRGWPLACDETMFRFQGRKAHHVHL